jgi:hypothetical protein
MKIEQKKQITQSKNGSRHSRKLKKFSEGFNEKYLFFLKSYRTGILTFCGEDVVVENDINGVCSKEGFRLFDDGYFKVKKITSRQPNILRAVIIGKKSWGLWLDQWSQGIAEWSFSKQEIVQVFSDKGIKIPDSFMLDFDNRIKKYRQKIYGN